MKLWGEMCMEQLSLLIIILSIVAITSLCIWNKLGVPFMYQTYPKLYTKTDILKLESMVNGHKQWHPSSILTILMSLYNRGIVTIKYENKWRHRPASALDLHFALQAPDSVRLRADERYMINALFHKKKGTVFAIRSIVIPDFSNRSLSFRLDYYFSRFNKLFYHLWQWSKLIRKQYSYSDLEVHKWRRDSLICSSYALTLFLQIYGMNNDLSIAPWVMKSSLPYWIGLFVALTIWMIAVFLGAHLLLRHPSIAKYLSWFSNNRTLNGLKKVWAVIIIFNVIMQLIHDPSTLSMQLTALASILCIVAGYSLPVHVLHLSIDPLKQQLIHGHYQNVSDPQILEWLLQASIVMKCGHAYLATHSQIARVAADHPEYPMLVHAPLMVQAMELIDASLIAFEDYEQEYSEYYEYGPEGITVWRENSVSRALYPTRH